MTVRHLLCISWALALCLGDAVLVPSSSFADETSNGRPDNRKEHLETFDAAWNLVRETYYDTNYNGVDWHGARARYRPKAEAAASRAELRLLIQEMLDLLGQSHMMIISQSLADRIDAAERREDAGEGDEIAPGDGTGGDAEHNLDGGPDRESAEAPDTATAPGAGVRDGETGLITRWVEGRMLVVRVEPQSAADKAGVKAGWVVNAVRGEPLSEVVDQALAGALPGEAEFLTWRLAQGMLSGRPGSKVEVEFLDGNGEKVRLRLSRERRRGEPVKLGNLPEMFAFFESSSLPLASGGTAGLMRFNIWMIPAALAFDRAMDRFRSSDGIIIDLRGNVGGIGGMIMGIAGHFFREPVSLGTITMRDAELHFLANPRFVSAQGERVEPFAGPVAILVDSLSLSASELFAGGMQDVGRARLFGRRTGGQALPALFDRLPNGDVLYHVVANYVTPSGVRLEGRGVDPDVPVEVSQDALLKGRDETLEAALAWIDVQAREQSASTAEPEGTGEDRSTSVPVRTDSVDATESGCGPGDRAQSNR